MYVRLYIDKKSSLPGCSEKSTNATYQSTSLENILDDSLSLTLLDNGARKSH